jgi:polyferredoxin
MTTPILPVRSDPLDALPRLDRHKPKNGPVAKSKVSRKRAYVLIGVHLLIGAHIVQWLSTGTTVTPVEPSEAGYLLDEGKLNAGVILFAVAILGTLVFGRWFCGWACHLVALQDLSAWLLGRMGLKPRPIRSRLLVFAPFVVAFHMFVEGPLLRWWYGVDRPPIEAAFTTSEFWERFPGPIMATLQFVVLGFFVVWWMGAKGFCTHGCPYGAFFAIADRFAPMRIVVNDACNGCGHCTSVCTSNVRVHEEVAKHKQIVDPGCMKCLDCVSVCPTDALSFAFAKPKPFATSQNRITARADFTWPEEIALAVVALAATIAFRGAWFGEHVPFLLAVGLGIVTAVFALLAWRLVRRRDVAFQHTELKKHGARNAAGSFALVGSLAWTALFVDCAGVRWHAMEANAIERTMAPWSNPGQRQKDLLAYDAALANAESWELVEDPEVQRKRGLAQRDLAMLMEDPSRMADAEARLRRALAAMPESLGALVPLADVLHVTGRDPEAVEMLQRADRARPGNAEVQKRLQALQGGSPR